MIRQVFAGIGLLALVLGPARAALAQPELYSGFNEGKAVLKSLEDEELVAGAELDGATFPGYLLSGAAGIDFGALRFEGEVLYNRLLVDDLSLAEPSTGKTGSVSSLAGMANALVELPARNGMSPFVGGGFGYGMQSSGNMTLRTVDLSNSGEGTMVYQLRAGFDYAVLPWSKMSLGYRYLLARDMETGPASRDRIDANRTTSHLVELGFHFSF